MATRATTKNVTIHYRRLTDEGSSLGGKTLENALRTALRASVDGVVLADSYNARIWHRGPQGEDNLLLNHFDASTDPVFGDLIHFSKDHLQALIEIAPPEAKVVNVRQLPAPAKMEYVHSLMYWMVKGNHVFVVQSQSLKSDTLEDYFGWLLCRHTKTVQPEVAIILSSKFDDSEIGGELNDIHEIVIGGEVPLESRHRPATPAVPFALVPSRRKAEVDDETIETSRTVEKRHESGFQQARAVLQALLGGQVQVDHYLDRVPEEAELFVDVHIGYRTKKRKINRAPLAELETGLRNLADGQIQVAAKGGKKSAAGDVRLHHNVTVKTRESLLDLEDVKRAFREAYQVLLNNGKINT